MTPEEARRPQRSSAVRLSSRRRCSRAGAARLVASSWPTNPRRPRAGPATSSGLDIRGHVVQRLWIEKASDIAKEYYLSLTFDRGEKKPLFMLTTEGGVDIEEVAAALARDARAASRRSAGGLPAVPRPLAVLHGEASPTRASRSRWRRSSDSSTRRSSRAEAMLCEINPLIVTPTGEVRALDAKVTIDDNALYRHPEARRAPRPRSRRPAGAARAGERARVRQARRRHRHPRQRCGAGDVDPRRRRAGRRQARKLL